MKNLVQIEKKIPVTIFDEPVLKKQVIHLFKGAEEKIKERVNEIIRFIKPAYAAELSYDNNIDFLFKECFYKLILNEAIVNTFSGQGNYDVLSNIISLLTEEKLETAIMGEPMIEAFEKAIQNIHSDSVLDEALHIKEICLLRQEFLGKTIRPALEEKKEEEICYEAPIVSLMESVKAFIK